MLVIDLDIQEVCIQMIAYHHTMDGTNSGTC